VNIVDNNVYISTSEKPCLLTLTFTIAALSRCSSINESNELLHIISQWFGHVRRETEGGVLTLV